VSESIGCAGFHSDLSRKLHLQLRKKESTHSKQECLGDLEYTLTNSPTYIAAEYKIMNGIVHDDD